MLTVPLPRFVRVLKLATEFDVRHENLGQVDWLFRHWSFDDEQAYFHPLSHARSPPAIPKDLLTLLKKDEPPRALTLDGSDQRKTLGGKFNG